jgi:hypothetical protein
MRRFCNKFFVEFGLDVYNIFKKLELTHAHYEANIMRPSSHSMPQPPLAVPTRSLHSFSRVKAMHLATPILPYYNYYSNSVHKANECNILFEDLFCDYCGKEEHQEVVYFVKFLEWK